MPDKRFIFVPFARDSGAHEGLQAATEWDTHSSNKRTSAYKATDKGKTAPWYFVVDTAYTTVCYRDEVLHVPSWSTEDVIYVLGGHSAPGSTTIKTTANFQNFELDGDQVAKRLVEQFTLGKSFIGQIKLYTCDGTQPKGLISVSFGHSFVESFKSSCPECKVFAYAAKVEQEHNSKFNGVLRKSGEADARLGRAKEFRLQIYPP